VTSSDVLVVGGGPAGSTVAHWLSTRGISVVQVVDRARQIAPAAETMPPQLRPELRRVGISLSGGSVEGLESYGIDASWGGARHFRSHVVDAEGNGWHVDKYSFTRALLRASQAAGTTVLSSRVFDVTYRRAMWDVSAIANGRRQPLLTRFLIDATGRPATIAKKLGARRRTLDLLCGVSAVVERPQMPQTLCVESTPYGWWYVAPFTEKLAVATVMSDHDLIRSMRAYRPPEWKSLLRRTQLPAASTMSDLCVTVRPCESSILDRVAGDGWAAVGDAASLLDPLASAGVLKAVHGAHIVGQLAVDYLHGTVKSALDYHAYVYEGFRRYIVGRQAQYRLEHRWADQPFWRRRNPSLTFQH
jgi:flavin-dependent dehydrogenase